MNNEIWKDVIGYEGLYLVSNLGRVKSIKRQVAGGVRNTPEKILKQHLQKEGYFTVVLYKDGIPKRLSVHRLVAIAFCDNPHNFPVVNHKDENKSNNLATNLEWCTVIYNMNYGTVGKRIAAKKRKIKNAD